MDIKLSCYACGQHVVVDSSAGGSTVNCPTCGTELIVPEVELVGVEKQCSSTPPPVPPHHPQLGVTTPQVITLQVPLKRKPKHRKVAIVGVAVLGAILFYYLFLNGWYAQYLVESDQVTIRQAGWNLVKASDGYLVRIKYALNNTTGWKIKNLKLDVEFINGNGDIIFNGTLPQFSDKGMDFVPPHTSKECEPLITLTKTVPSSIKKVRVEIQGFQTARMTKLDTRLYALWKIGDDFDKSERETMTPEEEQAEEEFIQLLKTKKQQASNQ